MQLTIDTTEEGLGCTATCREIPQLYGYGNTPGEARAMFWREVQSMWKDLSGPGEFSQEFVKLKEKLSQAIACKKQHNRIYCLFCWNYAEEEERSVFYQENIFL